METWTVFFQKISSHAHTSPAMVGPLALCSSKLTIKVCWLVGS